MDQRYNFYNLEPLFAQYLSAENNENSPITKSISDISRKNYLSDFRFFSGWFTTYPAAKREFEGITELVQTIQVETIEAFRDYMINSHLPVQTVNRRLSSIRKFFEFAQQQNWISFNPAKKVVNIKNGEQTILLKDIRDSLEEYGKTLKTKDTHDLEIIKDFFITN